MCLYAERRYAKCCAASTTRRGNISFDAFIHLPVLHNVVDLIRERPFKMSHNDKLF